MTEPPRRPATGGGAGRGAPRPRSGGRIAGKPYAPMPPAKAGKGPAFPYRDYSDIQPPALRDAYEWWQDICFDIRERRPALALSAEQVAERAGVSPNTVESLERGQWVASHILLRVASVLGLRIEQAVPVRRARSGGAAPGVGGGAGAAGRVATREDVLAARRVLRELAAHFGLGDPRVEADGTVVVDCVTPGFGPLWRFAAVAGQTLGAGVEVASAEPGRRRIGTELL
ncbi:helix-turn-helix transcriptional regulator [Blastococcus sp. PRF04-17]|uniref:helix-turn-helix transcriptional regulator n=1 Tax=Blastococcus sp. PRF04-17 TaxID=2933797 RepID=UPI001FF50A53|nr:helix-turn-helix transcriptional regulator [Blastococcus sp. PRF04-17]UOY01633.1 helix-turn-helix transcriptional regulator [Blastococcus sp. PRF04-17]